MSILGDELAMMCKPSSLSSTSSYLELFKILKYNFDKNNNLDPVRCPKKLLDEYERHLKHER